MIITLTGNLLAERTFTFERWTAGKTQRAQSESFQVGGKGINVAKMLSRIGGSTTAWCFVGGAAGQECATWLAQSGIPHRTFQTSAPTRSGLVVRQDGAEETTFLGPDRMPDADALRVCAEALREERRTGTVLALCGSFPGWASTEAAPLREELARWAEAGALVADTYGPPLSWLLEQPVSLVKINRQEFDPLFSESERTQSVLERISLLLDRARPRGWIVTDGPGPICFGSSDVAPGTATPVKVHEVSATGSGDVFFACVLHALNDRKLGLAEAVRFGIPFAAANAAHPGVADFDLNNLPR